CNTTGPAFYGDGLRVEGDLFLNDGFTATGAGKSGAVRLVGASVGGHLIVAGAAICNATGPAFYGDGLRVEGDLFLNDGFTATGAGRRGTVRLNGARVGGLLSGTSGIVSNATGPALAADRLRVDGSLFLGVGFTATGAGDSGAVRLLGAHIGNQLSATGVISNATGPALYAHNLQVDGNLVMTDGFTASSGPEHPALVLTMARVGGLALDLAGIKHLTGANGTLDVDGLVYAGSPQGPSVADWLAAFAHRTPSYSAQPYQQLAAATRAAGHDGDTRRVLMAQRRDQIRRRAVTGFSERTWAKATGVLLGFGYQPWRALLYLLAVLAAAVTLAIIAGGHHGGLAHTTRTTTPNAACTTVEQIGVGIDLGLPLIKVTARDSCAATPTTAGEAITAAGWALQLLAWALATLFLAGFTGAVRKT
ncbi:hypothetical protein ACFTSF_04595, partial [Kribbella sp. NPDC056951]|uniref:hypothetical protein n=1 Tax=Kribbella sp. NPDC056951 TaxID=3345978 RepID=UPI003645F27C